MTIVKQHAPGSVSWVDLMTPDPEGARKFYEDLFGWSFKIGAKESNSYTMCCVGSNEVAGMAAQPPGTKQRSAWTVYFASDDIEASAKKIRRLGGQVVTGPLDVMAEGRMLVAADASGAVFGVWQAGRHPGATRIDEPGAMAWREVNVRDPRIARSFYTQLFGLEAREMPIPDMNYLTLHLGEQTVGGILRMGEQWPAEIPAHWMTYFAVDDIEVALKRVAAGGGQLHVSPFDTVYGRLAVVTDPWNAAFAVLKMAEGAAS